VDHLQDRLGLEKDDAPPSQEVIESLQARVGFVLEERKALEKTLHDLEKVQGRDTDMLADDDSIHPTMFEKLKHDIQVSRNRIAQMEDMVLSSGERTKKLMERDGVGSKLFTHMLSNANHYDSGFKPTYDKVVAALTRGTALCRHGETWSCKTCTFRNNITESKCGACEAERELKGCELLLSLDFTNPKGLEEQCKQQEGYWEEMLRDSFDCVICMEKCHAGGHSAKYAMLPTNGMDCGHHELVCESCFRKHAQSFLMDSSHVTGGGIPCICAPKCETVVSLQILKKILDDNDFQKMRRICMDAAIRENKTSKWCSNTVCEIGVVNDGGGGFGKCQHCDTLTCISCGEASHPGVSCEDTVDAKFKSYMHDKKFKQCPKCRFVVEKRDGCVAMHCRCGLIFCYQCCGVRKAEGTPYNQCKCDEQVHSYLKAHETMRNHNL